jgi:hypothetical protein
MANSASILAAALGALGPRLSGIEAVSSGKEKPVALVRRVALAGDPIVVPLGP